MLDRATTPPPSVATLRQSARFLYIPTDVTDWVSQRHAFSQAATFFGVLDHVFVNAGVLEVGEQIWTDRLDPDGQLSEPDRTTIDVDLRAVGDTLKLAMHHLRNDRYPGSGKPRGSGRGRGGTVIMTASLAGYVATTGAPLYSAAKHGVVGYMRALKGECRKVGIAISVIAPGITVTPMLLQGLKEGETLESWRRDVSGRGLAINDVETIAFLVAHVMGLGEKTNGHGYLVQDNFIQEIEGGIVKSRGVWMGQSQLDLFRGGREAAGFKNKI